VRTPSEPDLSTPKSEGEEPGWRYLASVIVVAVHARMILWRPDLEVEQSCSPPRRRFVCPAAAAIRGCCDSCLLETARKYIKSSLG
jgi:hypothetical protein